MNKSRVAVAGLICVILAVGAVYRVLLADTSPSQAALSSTTKKSPGSIPVVTRQVSAENFPIRRRTIGILETPATIIIRSRIDSQVQEQHVTDGQFVRKGDLLFTLDDREIRATLARDEATIAKDQAALTQTRAALTRTQELIAKKIAPQQQLELATAAYKAAQQTVQADEAVLGADRLRLGYARLVAPMDGRIGAVRVAPGNLVSANDSTGLATLTQMKPLRVAFSLPERDLTALREAAKRSPPATVRVYAPGETKPLASGALDFVDSTVDSSSGTIAAKATFANEHLKLWPGQYVDVEIDLSTRPDTVTVPTVAIQTGQKGPYVFVAKPDHTVVMQQIALVGIEGDRTAIGSGLHAGERVVIQGQFRLSDGKRWREAKGTPATMTSASIGSASAPLTAMPAGASKP